MSDSGAWKRGADAWHVEADWFAYAKPVNHDVSVRVRGTLQVKGVRPLDRNRGFVQHT